MTKFKAGDVVERTGRSYSGWLDFTATDSGPYVVTSTAKGGWIQINGYTTCDGRNTHPFAADNFKLVEQDDPLPPAPESVLYVESGSPVGTDAELLVKGSKYGGLLFELYAERKVDGVHACAGMRLDPDAALQLAHDLTRMAMEIKRKEKQRG